MVYKLSGAAVHAEVRENVPTSDITSVFCVPPVGITFQTVSSAAAAHAALTFHSGTGGFSRDRNMSKHERDTFIKEARSCTLNNASSMTHWLAKDTLKHVAGAYIVTKIHKNVQSMSVASA